MAHRFTPRVPLTATLALLAMGIPALSAGATKETERVERTVPMQAGGTVTLKKFSGRVEITGEPRSDVAIVAIRRRPVSGSTASSSTSTPMAARSRLTPTSATRTGTRKTTTWSRPTSRSRCPRAPIWT